MKKSKKILKTVFRILLLALCGGILGFNIYSANAKSLNGNTLPMPFGIGASVVLSGSMEPALSVGDLLIVRARDSYEIDDIVVYQSGNTPVVHRVVSISDQTVITRGDANNVNDEPFATTALKGEVIAAIPLVGYVVLALKTPIAVVMMLAVAVLLVEGSFRSLKSEKEAEQEKLKAEIRALMDELKEE